MNLERFLSRRFLLALGAVLGQFIPGVSPDVMQEIALVVSAFIVGESAVDFQRERTRPEIERLRGPVEAGDGDSG